MGVGTVNPVAGGRSKRVGHFRQRFQTRDLDHLTDHLASLLEAGLPVRQAVMHLSDHPLSRHMQDWLNLATVSIEEGRSLSDAWRSCAPRLLLSMVAAGEATGNLASTLRAWSTHARLRRKAIGDILRMLSYPGLLSGLMALLLIFVSRVVMPMFIGVYASLGLHPSGATAVVVRILDSAPRWTVGLTATIAVFTLALLVVRTSRPALWSKLSKWLPGRQLWRLRRTYTWSQLLRLHLDAGVALTDTLTELADIHNPVWMRKAATETLSRVMAGQPPALAFTGDWDPLLTVLLRWAEQTGEIGAAFARVEAYTQEVFEERLRRLVQVLEPALLFVMGGLVSACMYVVYVPMYDMMTTVSTGHWS
ncbi:type II secretion system F family protein [Alicyclobacillus sp. ALC3]|uniref:type II secretion system F family protein n=1 Tax=Alicyclobacillus sp. ALC3 TaxID=2796143 RepID=UPI0023780BDE|nr:type II secretion system F family protein [Alicyclobacillus sp. ALC3]WDL97004.1 type II secretion system F family protein [Alicyclobacillus sp. ALC3]